MRLPQPVRSFTGNKPYGHVGRNISLKRSFRNILKNGVTYGDQVHMIFAQSGNLLIITIQDQGPGIPEENLEEVFEPFVRLDKERNTESGSVGLGLSIARTIIHNHGGTIAATNTNPGLKVTITLPTVKVLYNLRSVEKSGYQSNGDRPGSVDEENLVRST